MIEWKRLRKPAPRRTLWLAALALTAAAVPASSIDVLDQRILALQKDLRGVVASNGWRSARYGVLALSLDTGDTLFAQNPDQRLAPASNLKLVTTAAALHYLGSDFRYQTFLLADGPVEGGHLRGDLVLYGTGDPGISDRFQPTKTSLLEALADSLLAAGVTVVEGSVVGDGSFFSGSLRGEGWDPRDLNDWFAAPTSALAFNENVVTLRVAPTRAGAAPEVHTIPEGADLSLRVTAITGGGRGRIRIERSDPTEPISIEGSLAGNGREVWRQMTVSDPAHYAASVFRTVLTSRGIEVRGGARSVEDAVGSRVTGHALWAPALDAERSAPRILARHESPPLLDYLKVVNKKSHNLFADLALKTIGRTVGGDGSFAGGSRVVATFLADAVGTDTAGLRQVDGSGLSEMDQMSAATFVDVMKHMAESGLWDAYWETLPEAGNPRELRRMYKTAAAGNLRAKTGTIEHVSALSGMVRSANGERILFSIVANDVPSTYGAKRMEDRIGSRLAAFQRPFEPTPDEVRIAAEEESGDRTEDASPEAAAGSAEESPPAAAASAPSAPSEPRTHVVRSGENLTVIARRYGVTLDALVGANPGLSPRRLMPGIRLRVPGADAVAETTGSSDRKSVQSHQVRAGESLTAIAHSYGVSLNDLLEANPGVDPRRLQLGQTVRIPAMEGR